VGPQAIKFTSKAAIRAATALPMPPFGSYDAGGSFTAAKELAERIRKTSPFSIAAIKRVAHAAWNLDPSQADVLEEAAFPKLFGSEQSVRMHTFLKQQVSTED